MAHTAILALRSAETPTSRKSGETWGTQFHLLLADLTSLDTLGDPEAVPSYFRASLCLDMNIAI